MFIPVKDNSKICIECLKKISNSEPKFYNNKGVFCYSCYLEQKCYKSGLDFKKKLTPKEDLYNWLVDNFEEVAQDLFSEVAEKHAEDNDWDIIDIIKIHFMVEEIIENVKERILNVVSTYEESEG